MQGVPASLLLDEQFTLCQNSDTAHPQPAVPIYLIHGGNSPFCTNTSCFCQRAKRAGAVLYPDIAAGKLLLAQLVTGEQPAITDQPHRAHVLLDEHSPEMCQLYGHSWMLTEHQDVKECLLCGVRGYCPGCTPQAPVGATAFYCTSHTGRVQP